MPVFEFERPQRFVAGTVGPPGQRTFFLQARDASRLVSVSCEKEQLLVLAERIEALLDEYAAASGGAVAGTGNADNDPLEAPIEDEFRVNTISLGWDPQRGAVLLEADREPDLEEGEQSAGNGDEEYSVRVVLLPAQARAFVQRTRALVAAGRPPCPFCGGPLDAGGHICPRANGYRR
ncbi:MAG: DUF3090 domain-containing protein [Dermatophilaceae bacterium]